MMWREEERSRIRMVHMGNLIGLSRIRRMDRVLNVPIRELCGVTKGVDERIEESFLRWFGHIERKGNYRIPIRVFEGMYMKSFGRSTV